ncbi:MAG: hypothetical protein IT388_11605 [Nitrospirales bacterium]|nr:hypothetical protein [Nitrospirales bacterium]
MPDYVARGEADAEVVCSTDAMARSKEIKIAATALEGSHTRSSIPSPWFLKCRYPTGMAAFVS